MSQSLPNVSRLERPIAPSKISKSAAGVFAAGGNILVTFARTLWLVDQGLVEKS